MPHQDRVEPDAVFLRRGLVPRRVPHHQDMVGGIALGQQLGDAGGLAAGVLAAEHIHRVQQAAAGPFLLHRFPVGAGHHRHIRPAVGGGQPFGRPRKGALGGFGQGVDGRVDLAGPGQRLGHAGPRRPGQRPGQPVVGKFRRRVGPGPELGQALDGGIAGVDLGQGHRQALEPVDPAGHGVEVDLVPPRQDGPGPWLQAPLLHHAGAETALVLDVHGVHGAAVRIDADEKLMGFDKMRQVGHRGFLLCCHGPRAGGPSAAA